MKEMLVWLQYFMARDIILTRDETHYICGRMIVDSIVRHYGVQLENRNDARRKCTLALDQGRPTIKNGGLKPSMKGLPCIARRAGASSFFII